MGIYATVSAYAVPLAISYLASILFSTILSLETMTTREERVGARAKTPRSVAGAAFAICFNAIFYLLTALFASFILIGVPFNLGSRLFGYESQEAIASSRERVEWRIVEIQNALSAPISDSVGYKQQARLYEERARLSREVVELLDERASLHKRQSLPAWLENAVHYGIAVCPTLIFVLMSILGMQSIRKRRRALSQHRRAEELPELTPEEVQVVWKTVTHRDSALFLAIRGDSGGNPLGDQAFRDAIQAARRKKGSTGSI